MSYASSILRYKKYQLQYNCNVPEPYKLIYVDPFELNTILAPPFHKKISRYGIHIKGGAWDLNVKNDKLRYYRHHCKERKLVKFENFEYYTELRKYIKEGLEWEKTSIHKHLTEIHSTNFSQKEKEKIDRLVESIQEHGYLSQRELVEKGLQTTTFPCPERAEVEVNIGRDGQIIFEDGKHRLCLAKILELDQIPVRIFAVHKKLIKESDNKDLAYI